MKKILALLLATLMIFSFVACGKKEKDEKADSSQVVKTESVEKDPAEYTREFWEKKYPNDNICPFTIDENGVERSYYWASGIEGWNGTFEAWVDQPFNWNGWHKLSDGTIVNKDETLKITDAWANGDESMSSCCIVTTEKYEKDGNRNSADGEKWPSTEYAKPKNCEIDSVEDWGSYTKIYVKWDSKDAAKEYKAELKLGSGTAADVDGVYEFNNGKVMISYSDSNPLANFISIFN